MAKWIQEANERMEEKGTRGKFGKATAKKIASGKKKGGVAKKEAVFAENMKKIAAKRKRKGLTVKDSGHRSAHSSYSKAKAHRKAQRKR